MKINVFKFGIVLIVFIVLISAANAKVAEIIPPIPRDEGIGQNQWYSVVLDEEGDAIVAAKLTLQNTGKEAMKNFVVEIAGKEVRLINAIQEVQKKRKECTNWQDICLEIKDNVCIRFERKCIDWYEYPVWPPYYYTLERSEKVLSKSTIYTFNLSKPIAEQETATVLLYYKVSGYVEKSLGVFDFDFETIKWNFDTNKIRVALNVQEGLFLKGGKAKVEYREGLMVYASAEKAVPPSGVQSESLQQFSSQIEWQEGLVKTASGLDPLESFHVKGSYSTSRFLLYKGIILIVLLVIVAIVLAGIYAVKRIKWKPSIAAKIVLIGLASSILLIGVWFLLSYLLGKISEIIGWQYQSMFVPLIVLFGGIFILLILFGPPVYMGLKHGAMIGMFTLVSTMIWLFIILVIMIILFGLIKTQPPIIYYAKGFAEATK